MSTWVHATLGAGTGSDITSRSKHADKSFHPIYLAWEINRLSFVSVFVSVYSL